MRSMFNSTLTSGFPLLRLYAQTRTASANGNRTANTGDSVVTSVNLNGVMLSGVCARRAAWRVGARVVCLSAVPVSVLYTLSCHSHGKYRYFGAEPEGRRGRIGPAARIANQRAHSSGVSTQHTHRGHTRQLLRYPGDFVSILVSSST